MHVWFLMSFGNERVGLSTIVFIHHSVVIVCPHMCRKGEECLLLGKDVCRKRSLGAPKQCLIDH